MKYWLRERNSILEGSQHNEDYSGNEDTLFQEVSFCPHEERWCKLEIPLFEGNDRVG